MKKARQQKILEIIARENVETQEDLVRLLGEYGCEATQATVSRDIRELQLSKVTTPDGGQRYALLAARPVDMEDKYTRVLREGYLSMDMAQNILVIRTVSGMAMAVAAALDAMQLRETVGCIAGDDTIMVAVRTVEDTRKLMDKLHNLLGN